MAQVLHGDGQNNQLNARVDKSQVYGLQGNDTLTSDGKSDVLLVGGSGDDSLIMTGGNGTLSGGDGSDTFELTYSADKKLSATIEDLDPASDKIVVNFAGTSTPQLTTVTSGNDVILRDGERLNVTLNGVRENDYFDGTISDAAWDVLELTNAEREKHNRTALTMSDGLTAGASIRVQEITAQGESGILTEHIRPGGTSYVTVFDEVGKHYPSRGENIQAGAKSPEAVMDRWINSASHYANIVNPAFLKLGVGYNYDDSDPSDRRFYWEQLFGGSLSASERATVSTVDLLTASVTTDTVSKSITLTENPDTYANSDYDVTIAALSGADQITNSGLLASISGGADNDTLINNASFATINAGAGNDSIRLSNAQENLIQYAAGDGSDTISGLNSSDTLSITGGEFAPVTVGNNLIVNVGDDSITLVDAARSGVQIVGSQKNFFRGTERADNMTNTVEGAIIAALGGNDTITNSGDNVSINAGVDNDSINSWGNNVVFFHESGNDTIQGFGSNSTLKVAGGSYTSLRSDYYNLILIDSESGDSINILNGAYNSTINIMDAEGNPVTVGNALNIVGTELADNLSNTFNSATIRALGGDDTITNSGSNVSISGGAGNDSIDSGGVWSSIDAGAGDDSIQNSGYDVTISAGAGNDSVSNTAIQVTISAGAGNDSIVNNASQVSINGGVGDDYLNNNGQLLTAYTYESGNDTIEGFNASDSLNVGGYSYSTVENDDGIIVNVLNRSATVGTVTLKDYSGQYVNIVSTYAPSTVRGIAISNSDNAASVVGTAGNDSITNSGASVTIAGNKGDDRISLSGGATNNLIEYASGDGNDTVSGFNATSTLQIGDGSGTYATVQSGSDVIVRVGNGSVLLDSAESLGSINIDGSESTVSSSIIPLTEGDDTYSNSESDVTILALGGDDYVYSNSDNVSIDGGADNDTINFNGINVTVTGGTGNDAISDNTDIAAHVYTGGNDTIYGFDRWSTIVIADSWSSIYGNNGIVIAVSGKGSLTLDDYWYDINVVSSLDDVTHYNRLYSSGDNSTVTGTNDADHLGLWNDSVTVDAAGGGDYIYVAEANDSINVGDGDDTVRMYTAANTTVEGGTGKNIFVQWGSAGTAYVYGGGNDTIEDYNQHQTLVIADSWTSVRSGGTTTINVTGKGTIIIRDWWDDINIVSSVAEAKRYNFIRNNSSYSNVTGTGGDDFIKNHSSATVNAAGGDDVVFNWSTQSSINGGAGTDSIYNNYTDVTINGGADNDTINSYGSSNSIIDGGTGNDFILQGWITGSRRTGDFSTLTGGDGDDTLDNYCGKNVSISGGNGNDNITNDNATTWNSATQQSETVSSPDNTTIDGGAGTDTISNYGANVSIDGGAGNDDIRNYSDASNTTILGGTGDDTVENYGGRRVSILGGTGNDYIRNENATQWNSSTQQYETVSSPDNTTIDGGAGDDTINNYGARVSIDGGDGNDYIRNENATQWNSLTQQDETLSSPDNATLDGGDGDDNIDNYGNSVSISGGAGNDWIYNYYASSVTIDGGAGNDYVYNRGTNVSISGGDGSDSINNYGSSVSISGGAGNDSIGNWGGSNVTMLGGTGNDEIYLSADSRNNFIRYADGDGNDTVWGITENDTLNLLADGYSTVEGRGDDLIVNVITNDVVTGSILLIGARNNPPHITLGESGTEGGGSGSGGSGSSGSGSGGSGGGNDSGGNTSGGTSASEGRGSAASGGRSASGSSGTQTSTGISSSSGRVSRYVSTNRKDSIASAAARNLYNEMTATNQQAQAQQTTTATTQNVYTGGNQVISNYQSGEKIIFGADYTGAFYDGAGNFFAGSSTGALAIENAMDKVIDLSDAAGNDFVKAYAATTAGVIDGRNIAGFELINGSSGADWIFAGDGGSQLWGGADVATDILVGGGGSDIFIVSKYQGSDLIVNASSRDMVYLSDANLNDIIATEENNGVVAVAFNTGNVVAVQSSEALSSTFLLNDGSQYRYNHANKSWQTA